MKGPADSSQLLASAERDRWTRRLAAAWPTVAGAGWLAWLLGAVARPDRILANRDILAFHLPLREDFRRLFEAGGMGWNPWLHGGEPVFSNPSYGAFYPPSWLALAVPPAHALGLLALLHAAIGLAGAFHLMRGLGCRRSSALLAGVAFTGSCAVLSLLSAFTLFLSIAWLPWVVLFGDLALRAAPGRWLKAAVLASAALGLQLLNGEPVTAVMSGLALLALALAQLWPRPRAVVLRLMLIACLSAVLAAAQLVPTLARLHTSPRSLSSEQSGNWSLPPVRLAELVYPRLLGDPSRGVEGLDFGGSINDHAAPYVASLYPGLLITVLGLAGLVGGVARRGTWAILAVGGFALALGRHGPWFVLLRHLPVLASLRYFEKFAVLAVVALGFAAALTWDRLLSERDSRTWRAMLPLFLSGVVLVVFAVVWWQVESRPDVVRALVAAYGLAGATPKMVAAGVEGVRAWTRDAVLWGVAVTGLLVALRVPRLPTRALSAAAIVLVAGDLWWSGHRLLVTVPASLLAVPPEAAGIAASGDPALVVQRPADAALPISRSEELQAATVMAVLGDLTPYSPRLWRLPSALDPDIEAFSTRWADVARQPIESLAGDPEALARYVGAWNVGVVALPKDLATLAHERATNAAAAGRVFARNLLVLPRLRSVARITCHPSLAAAVAAATAERFALATSDHAVCADQPGERRFPAPLELSEVSERNDGVTLTAGGNGGFLILASTFDEGFEARIDGRRASLLPTAAGQIGLMVPAGQHRIEIAYRDRSASVGLGISGLALVLAGGLWRRRWPVAPADEGVVSATRLP